MSERDKFIATFRRLGFDPDAACKQADRAIEECRRIQMDMAKQQHMQAERAAKPRFDRADTADESETSPLLP